MVVWWWGECRWVGSEGGGWVIRVGRMGWVIGWVDGVEMG